jgi:carbon monoxide dehydrogenase subunit G
MFTDEKFRIKAPIQRVWDFIVDPKQIGSCIPGCEHVEVVGENAYKTTVRIKLPIFSITAKATTTFTEITPPHHLKSVTEGEYDLGGGRFHQESVLDLTEISEGEVEISYTGSTRLEGGFAGFGEKIINSAAKAIGEQFAKNIQTKIGGEGLQ